MLLCVITRGRGDASLACAISMLRLQTALMTLATPVRADLQFVETPDAALNALHAHPAAVGALLADASMGFDAEFPLRALESGLPVVVACAPTPTMDWERVKRQAAADSGEDPQFWGLTYGVTPVGRIGRNGYVRVERPALGVAWVRKDALAAVAAAHPEAATDDGTVNFAVPGVYAGRRLDADARFAAVFGGETWADVERPATTTGPLEYGGCVGARSVLR